MTNDETYMTLALEQAKIAQEMDEVPIGVVVVKDQQVIAKAHNQMETSMQATYHAEILAIQMASVTLGDWRLDGCELYVTKEPCPMCAGAMVNSRIKRIIFGCPEARTAEANIARNILQTPNAVHHVEITPGVLQKECQALLQDFFRNKRKLHVIPKRLILPTD